MTTLSIASVTGLGPVLTGPGGLTVYELSSPTAKNLPCTAASGCTASWIPVTPASGTTGALAGTGASSSLLGTTTVGGAQLPTYNGYLLYEFTGDSAPGQAAGQGISSFGGTWRVLNAAGSPVTASTGPTGATGSSW